VRYDYKDDLKNSLPVDDVWKVLYGTLMAFYMSKLAEKMRFCMSCLVLRGLRSARVVAIFVV
jgi:hypothetical protein